MSSSLSVPAPHTAIVWWLCVLLLVVVVVACALRFATSPPHVLEPFVTSDSTTPLTLATANAFQTAINDLITALNKRLKPLQPLTGKQRTQAIAKNKAHTNKIQNTQMQSMNPRKKKFQVYGNPQNDESSEGFTTAQKTPHAIYIDACTDWYHVYNDTYAKNINNALKIRNNHLDEKKKHAHQVKKAVDAHTKKVGAVHAHHCATYATYSGETDPSKCPLGKSKTHTITKKGNTITT